MRSQHIRIPSIPLALAAAALTFAAVGFGASDSGFLVRPAYAGGASASAKANATVETKSGNEEMSKDNCRSEASSHAKATASDGEQTITREDYDHDEGSGCSAHSSAKATSRVSGSSKAGQN